MNSIKRRAAAFLFYALVLVTVMVFAAGFSGAGPGLYAPLVALFVALTAMLRRVFRRHERLVSIYMGLGAMGSAYLWMADAAGVPAWSLQVPLLALAPFGIAVVWAAAVIVVLNPQMLDIDS